jgi:hypothetical protein
MFLKVSEGTIFPFHEEKVEGGRKKCVYIWRKDLLKNIQFTVFIIFLTVSIITNKPSVGLDCVKYVL